MRKLIAGLGICAAMAIATEAYGQSPGQSVYEKDDMAISAGSRKAMLDPRRADRARQAAEERLQRIESRHWNGISMQRPTIYTGPNAGTEILFFQPWQFRGPNRYYTYRDWVR